MPRPAACKKVGSRRFPANRSRARTTASPSASSNIFEEADQDQAGPSDAGPPDAGPSVPAGGETVQAIDLTSDGSGPAVAGPSSAVGPGNKGKVAAGPIQQGKSSRPVSGAGHAAPARMSPGPGSPTRSVVLATAHRVTKSSPTKSSVASLRSVLDEGRAGPSSSSRLVDPIVVHSSDSESDPNATQSDGGADESDVEFDDAATRVATGDTTSDECTLVGSDESDQLGGHASDDHYHIDWDDDQGDDDYYEDDDAVSLFSSASADSSRSILGEQNGTVFLNVQPQPPQQPAPAPAPVPEDVAAALAPVGAAGSAVAGPHVFSPAPPTVPGLQAAGPAPAGHADTGVPAGAAAGPPPVEPVNAGPAAAISLAGPTTVGPPASGPPVATDATVATVPPQADIAAVASNALNIFHARLPEPQFSNSPAVEERIARERRNETSAFFSFFCQGNDSLFDNGGYGVSLLDHRTIVDTGDLQLHFTRKSMSGFFVSLGVFRVNSSVLRQFSYAWQTLISQYRVAANYVKRFDEEFAQEIRVVKGQTAGPMGSTFVQNPNSNPNSMDAGPVVMVRRYLEAYVCPPVHKAKATDLPAMSESDARIEAARGEDETRWARLVLENRADEESHHELPLPAVPEHKTLPYKADFYAYATVPLANTCCERHIYVPRSYSEELHLDGRINIDVTEQFTHFGRRFDNGTFTNVMEALLLIMHGRDDRVRRMYGLLATEIGIQLLADLDMVFLAGRMLPHFFD